MCSEKLVAKMKKKKMCILSGIATLTGDALNMLSFYGPKKLKIIPSNFFFFNK
jgi:hypothetical protein